MVAKPANSLNLSQSAGVVSWDGTASTSTSSVNQYAVIIGSTSQGVANVSPSATAGVPLVSNGGSANPSFSTALVAGGGTGVVTMTTAYAPVCAGTTATGALQVASTGLSSSGYVLTSNGSSALPSFQAAPGGSGFTRVATQVFVYTGGGQTYTPTTNMKYCIIEALGGGGGGGGSAAVTGQFSDGAGGGSGEYAAGTFSAATIGASKTVTIGAGGAGNSGAAGSNGGNTSVGALISAYGGTGGSYLPASNGTAYGLQGGAGGTGGSGGSVRFPGAQGGECFICGGVVLMRTGSGNGGRFSGAVDSIVVLNSSLNQSTNGNAATGYGGGGGGALGYGTGAAATGGAGSAGIVIITEYI